MEDKKKRNCWECMKCGRNPGGSKVHRLGACPATTDGRYDGINGGRNGGRCCWAIVGTLCDGDIQGTFAHKFEDCLKCPFYLEVERQEGRFFILIPPWDVKEQLVDGSSGNVSD